MNHSFVKREIPPWITTQATVAVACVLIIVITFLYCISGTPRVTADPGLYDLDCSCILWLLQTSAGLSDIRGPLHRLDHSCPPVPSGSPLVAAESVSCHLDHCSILWFPHASAGPILHRTTFASAEPLMYQLPLLYLLAPSVALTDV